MSEGTAAVIIICTIIFCLFTGIILTFGEPSIVEAIAVRIGGAW